MTKKIRYAVVGLGHIAQVAVLPAFKQSRKSELVALVSGDAKKLKMLSRKYGISTHDCYSYEEYEECLKSGKVDAVYIALPNHLHRQYAVKAAEAGIHVLCEKPMAVTSRDCDLILRSARNGGVKLMLAYRLHFDPANLKAIQLAHSGKLGEPRYFTSEFGYQLKGDNIRMEEIEGGSPLNDIGIYCINAARYLFKAEPDQVFAYAVSPDKRFSTIYETVSAVMRFPGGRLASFTCSFGSGAISNYRIVGTKGDLFIENVYEYVGELKHRLTVDEKAKEWRSKPGDQFAAELEYFSDCVQRNKDPEPSGKEGLIDVKIIEALYRSIRTGRPVSLKTPALTRRPTLLQKIRKKPHREPKLIKVEEASR